MDENKTKENIEFNFSTNLTDFYFNLNKYQKLVR